MSRQILSYADLGPITSASIPSPSLPTPQRSPSRDNGSSEPPRKRVRVSQDESRDMGNGSGSNGSRGNTTSDGNARSVANGTTPTTSGPAAGNRNENGNETNGGGGGNANTTQRKVKKGQRPGNPGGVRWTQHWDAQISYEEANGAGGMAYEEEEVVDTAINPTTAFRGDGGSGGARENENGRAQAFSHRNSGRWNSGGGGGGGSINGSNQKSMPPPPSSFIGPVIPPSTTIQTLASGAIASSSNTDNLSGSRDSLLPRETGKKGKGKNNNRKSKKEDTSVSLSFANEEEWDDSALIDAWNAAEEEYRVMNGGKKWRCEPVKHSSLWHDEFHRDDTDELSDSADDPANNNDDHNDGGNDVDLQDSFMGGMLEETYVENAELSLASATATAVGASFFGQALGTQLPRGGLFGSLPTPSGTSMDRSSIMEEAFRRAQEASYSAGYWTAVYQMHVSQSDLSPPARSARAEDIQKRDDNTVGKEGVKEEEEGETEDMESFLPTQR